MLKESSTSIRNRAGMPWQYLFICFVLLESAWEYYLDSRQMRRYKANSPLPPELKELTDEESHKKANSYNKDKMQFGLVKSFFSLVLELVFQLTFFHPYLWNCGIRALRQVFGTESTWIDNEYAQTFAYFFIEFLVGLVLSLPWEIYYDFVLEEKHGFNKKTAGLFVVDLLKSTCLTFVLAPPITAAVISLIHWGGKQFYVYLWAFLMAVGFAAMVIYPNFIAPWFNKFEPLKDDELRKEIEILAGKLNFPLKKIYQVDESQRSAHSNAYFFGFFKAKRIVLYDTLLNLDREKIVAILGHELGHWKLGHTLFLLATGALQLFITLYLYGKVMYNDDLYESFGYHDVRATIIGLKLFSDILSPVSTVLGMLLTCLQRRFEFQADAFSVKLGYGEKLVEGLKELHKSNLGELNPDPLYTWFHFSHPPLLERIRAIKNIAERSKLD